MDKGYFYKCTANDLFLTSWSHLVHLPSDTSVINVMQIINHSGSLYTCQTYFCALCFGSSSEMHLLTAITTI